MPAIAIAIAAAKSKAVRRPGFRCDVSENMIE